MSRPRRVLYAGLTAAVLTGVAGCGATAGGGSSGAAGPATSDAATSGASTTGGASVTAGGATSSAAAVASAAEAMQTSGTAPLKIVHHQGSVLALAPVTINGKGPFVFAVDTGASSSLVDTSVAKQLGLSTSGSGKVAGVSCSTSVSHATLSNWQVGNITLPKDSVSVTDLPGSSKSQGLQGLLGSDVLHQFGQITLNYQQSRLAVGAAAATPSNAPAIPLKVVNGSGGNTLAFVPVHVRGKGPFPFTLDTGASTSTVATSLAQQVGLSITTSNHKVSGVGCSTTPKSATIHQWQVGGHALPGDTVDVLPLASGSGGSFMKGLLGSDILSTFGRITVDYAHQRLLLPSAAAGGSSAFGSAAASSTTASASGVPAGGTVRLKVAHSNGAVTVLAPVMIQGHGPFTFAVDTGAPQSLVTAKLAKAAGLQQTGAGGTLHGVLGAQQGYPAAIKNWQAGNVALPTETVVVTKLPTPNVDGLLGADTLAAFQRAAIDYNAQQLELGQAVTTPSSGQTVPLNVVRGAGVRILVPAQVQGHQTVLALDTGASQSALSRPLVQQLGLPQVGTRNGLSGVTSQGNVPLVKVSTWSLRGGVSLPTTQVLSLPLQQQQQLHGLLGSDVLSGFGTIVIDFGKQQLVVSKS